jgi:hypothetical protein
MEKSTAFLLALCLACTPIAQAQLSGEVNLGGASTNKSQEENQGNPQTKEITVTGLGENPQAAEKQAITDAVRQAVGSFIDANTLVQNEEVVRDRILSVSDGFVKEYKVTSPARQRDDGLYEITVIAVVETKQVVQALKEINLISGEVAGQNLWAEASTKVINAQDAVAMLEVKIPEFIKTAVIITPLNKDGTPMVVKDSSGKEIPSTAPAIVDEDASTGQATLTWFLEMGLDKKYYKETIFPLVKKCFDAISGIQGELLVSKLPGVQEGISIWLKPHDRFRMPGSQINQTLCNDRGNLLFSWDNGIYLIKSVSRNRDTIEALTYPNSKNRLVVDSKKESPYGNRVLAELSVKVIDADQEIIGSEQILAWQPFATEGSILAMVGPYAVCGGPMSGTLEIQAPIVQKISLKIPIPLLKEVKKVELSLEQVPFKLGLAKKE